MSIDHNGMGKIVIHDLGMTELDNGTKPLSHLLLIVG